MPNEVTVFSPDAYRVEPTYTLGRAAPAAGRPSEEYDRTVARLIEEGASRAKGRRQPRYVASGEGSSDLGRLAERDLRERVDVGEGQR